MFLQFELKKCKAFPFSINSIPSRFSDKLRPHFFDTLSKLSRMVSKFSTYVPPNFARSSGNSRISAVNAWLIPVPWFPRCESSPFEMWIFSKWDLEGLSPSRVDWLLSGDLSGFCDPSSELLSSDTATRSVRCEGLESEDFYESEEVTSGSGSLSILRCSAGLFVVARLVRCVWVVNLVVGGFLTSWQLSSNVRYLG